jgi:hypothetical protein
MKNKIAVALVVAGVFAGTRMVAPAEAQLSNMMPGMGGSGSGMSMPGIGSLGGGVPSVSSASPTNLAGVLQYCVQNNYLGGASASSASSVKDSLLSKFGGGSSSAPGSDSGYSSGSSGILDTGNGQTATLGGGGLKAEITQKVCAQVLSHSKSLL